MKTYEVKRVGELLTKRPEGMSYEEYRVKRHEQNRMLRGYTIEQGERKVSIPGRLECAVCIPANEWKNSRVNKVVFVN